MQQAVTEGNASGASLKMKIEPHSGSYSNVSSCHAVTEGNARGAKQ